MFLVYVFILFVYLEPLRQGLSSPSGWMVFLGSLGLSGSVWSIQNYSQYNPIYKYSLNGVILTVHWLASNTQM